MAHNRVRNFRMMEEGDDDVIIERVVMKKQKKSTREVILIRHEPMVAEQQKLQLENNGGEKGIVVSPPTQIFPQLPKPMNMMPEERAVDGGKMNGECIWNGDKSTLPEYLANAKKIFIEREGRAQRTLANVALIEEQCRRCREAFEWISTECQEGLLFVEELEEKGIGKGIQNHQMSSQ